MTAPGSTQAGAQNASAVLASLVVVGHDHGKVRALSGERLAACTRMDEETYALVFQGGTNPTAQLVRLVTLRANRVPEDAANAGTLLSWSVADETVTRIPHAIASGKGTADGRMIEQAWTRLPRFHFEPGSGPAPAL